MTDLDPFVVAAASTLARDALWTLPPPLAADCEHDLELLPVIEPRFTVVCRKCGGLDVTASRAIGSSPPDAPEYVILADSSVRPLRVREPAVVPLPRRDLDVLLAVATEVLTVAGNAGLDFDLTLPGDFTYADVEAVVKRYGRGGDLEERVAALEARLAPGPLLKPFDLPPLTEEQEAQLKRDFDETMRGPFTPHFLPSVPPLTPDQVRQLLRECVTVVKPGEHLILRIPWSTTPTQVRELQDFVTDTAVWLDLPFKVLVLPGDGLGVAEPGGVHGAA